MGIIEWTEKSGDENTGVDHLGMRVADESSYSKLIDFTTTVTWRPRYYSFLCWAAKTSFSKNGGDSNRETNRIDYKKYCHTIKRMEYAIVAASLLNDPNSSRVAGSDKVSVALKNLAPEGDEELELTGDHLKASAGGLGLYAGVMRSLDLLVSSEGVDIPPQRSLGDQLADAFSNSLSLTETNLLNSKTLSIDALRTLGSFCALNGLDSQAQTIPEVKKERDLIRSVIFDWKNFDSGHGSSSRRILSLGLIMESRKIYSERDASLELFREFTLLGAANISDEIIPLRLPNIYNSVLTEWKMYQTHAYATYALESLLSIVLCRAKELQESVGDNLYTSGLVYSVLELVEPGLKSQQADVPDDLSTWWEISISELLDLLAPHINNNRGLSLAEPELMSSIHQLAKTGITYEVPAWTHHSYLLFMLSIIRMRAVALEHGEDSWIGMNDSTRITPSFLINHFEQAVENNLTTLEYLQKVTTELVIKQHHQNALRKLLYQPDKDTSKFTLEGPRFIPAGSHKPGTSSPRYSNSLLFLQDLGLLTQGEKPTVTPDGELVLKKIRELEE